MNSAGESAENLVPAKRGAEARDDEAAAATGSRRRRSLERLGRVRVG